MATIREKLAAGKTVYGPFWKIDTPGAVEVAGYCGLDFAIFDMEHAPHSMSTVENLVRAAQLSGLGSVVRTPDGSENAISKALDTGAEVVLVPHVTTAEEARQVAEASHFYPLGHRGMDIFARAARYGAIPKNEYLSKENEHIMVAIQVEGMDAVSNLEEILAIPGIDIVFIGPYDLSHTMGIPGEVRHPKLLETMEGIVRSIREAGKIPATHVDDVEGAAYWKSRGARFISISVDLRILNSAFAELVSELRNLG